MSAFGQKRTLSLLQHPDALAWQVRLPLPHQRISESSGYTNGVDAATIPAVRAVAHCGLLVLPVIYGLLVSWRQSHRTSAGLPAARVSDLFSNMPSRTSLKV